LNAVQRVGNKAHEKVPSSPASLSTGCVSRKLENRQISVIRAGMSGKHIQIAGAGIAGLATAIAIARRGHGVTVVERTERFSPVGAGVQLGPNAVRALVKIGAWGAVEPFTYKPPEINIRDGRNGKLLKRVTLARNFEARFGMPYRVVHRAGLHEALLEVSRTHGAIDFEMGRAFDPSTSQPFIAADGVNSQTRRTLFPGSEAIPLAQTILRALGPLPSVNGINLAAVNLWLCPGGHVVHYPVGDNALNIVVVADGTTEGNWNAPPFHQWTEQLLALLSCFPEYTTWPALYVPPLPSWRKDNALLIGDAAHGTVPYLAQGAAMALEDAAALAEHGPDVDLHHLRAKRCARIDRDARGLARIYHASGPLRLARNLALSTMSEDRFIARLGWIYDGR
jgi:salicylate hydroxylase